MGSTPLNIKAVAIPLNANSMSLDLNKNKERIKEKCKKMFVVTIACWLIFGISGGLMAITENALFGIGIGFGFLGFMGSIFYLFYSLRCPTCTNNLGVFLQGYPGNRNFEKVKYCPYCALELDSEEAD